MAAPTCNLIFFCHCFVIVILLLGSSPKTAHASSPSPRMAFTCSRRPPPPLRLGLGLGLASSPYSDEPTIGEPEEEGRDWLDYFDPLLSPHMYPNGIDANKRRKQQRPSPSFETAIRKESRTASLPDEDALYSEFDPRLSPHAYPNGVDAGPVEAADVHVHASDIISTYHPDQENDNVIGILLVDHGSRRESSNQQLVIMAERYEQRLKCRSSRFRVYAAHMELASPTILQGIEFLAKVPGMTTILCHPYFLSPGRHVSEDVPQLILQAVHTLQDTVEFIQPTPTHGDFDSILHQQQQQQPSTKKIQLYMTEALGADLDSMIAIVDDRIQQTLDRVMDTHRLGRLA